MTKDEFKRLRHDIRCILRGVAFYAPQRCWGTDYNLQPNKTLSRMLSAVHPEVYDTLYEQRPGGYLFQPPKTRIQMFLNLRADQQKCEEWRKRVAA